MKIPKKDCSLGRNRRKRYNKAQAEYESEIRTRDLDQRMTGDWRKNL